MKPGRELDALVAEKVMGWKRGGKGDHTRPEHRKSKDYPGTIINDYENKGEHDYLVSPDGGEVRFCGCESTAEIPYFSEDIQDVWKVGMKACELLGPRVRLHLDVGGNYACAEFIEHHVGYGGQRSIQYHEDENGDVALAICLAALKALGAAKGGRE